MQPAFVKGYSRKGAALHALHRYNDSIAAYNEGLAKFPGDPALTKGLAQVQKEKEQPMGGSGGAFGAGGGLFSPAMMAQMALNPKLRPLLNDPQVMGKIKMIQQNPNLLPTMMSDPKMMQLLTAMMAAEDGGDEEGDSTRSSAATTNGPTSSKAAASEPEPMEEVEEDWSDLTPAEREKKEAQKKAKLEKERGNELYKAKQLDEALEAYDAAIALDPTNMTFYNNKAAVLFTQKKYQECVDMCLQAVAIGKEHMGPFEDRAKAYARAAKAYQKMKDIGKAIEMCQEAQLESYDANTQRLLKTLELEKKKSDAQSYQDDAKAEEAKQQGNEHFRAQDWAKAVQCYEDAVKRAPKNAPIRNNLAAALCKVMDFSGAQRQIETAIEIDPKYVKAWARKGDIEMVMKEYHKAMDSYKHGLELDPDNTACKDGLRKCSYQIQMGRQNMTDDEKKEQAAHAMADPQIQAILQDPVMQQVLKDLGENPAAGQQAMADPLVREKINKLIAAGIIETR